MGLIKENIGANLPETGRKHKTTVSGTNGQLVKQRSSIVPEKQPRFYFTETYSMLDSYHAYEGRVVD